jgi:hypothetical protein
MHVASFMSSLHLNLADGYRRLGHLDVAGPDCKFGVMSRGSTSLLDEDVVHCRRDVVDALIADENRAAMGWRREVTWVGLDRSCRSRG